MTNSLFNNNQAPATETTELPEGTSYLDTLVGEGKKYQDPELLAKGTWHAQVHISKIEQENAVLRAELEKRANAEEFTKQILERVKGQTPPSNEQTHQPSQEQKTPNTPDIAELVKQIYNQEQEKATANSNLSVVDSKLKEVWGQAYSPKLEQRAKELRVSPQFLENLAATSPDAFFEMVLKTPRPSDNSHLAPTGSGQTHGNVSSPNKTFNDYEKMRKSEPKKYWDLNTQTQMFEDARKLGADFYK